MKIENLEGDGLNKVGTPLNDLSRLREARQKISEINPDHITDATIRLYVGGDRIEVSIHDLDITNTVVKSTLSAIDGASDAIKEQLKEI